MQIVENKFKQLDKIIRDNGYDENMELLNGLELNDEGIIELKTCFETLIEFELFERHELKRYLGTEYNFSAGTIL